MFNFYTVKRERYRIACRRFDVAHSGVNIAIILTRIFKEFNFAHKTFYGLSDNGSNMIKGLTLMAEEEEEASTREEEASTEEVEEEEDGEEEFDNHDDPDMSIFVDEEDQVEPDTDGEEAEDNDVEDFADNMEIRERDQQSAFGSLGLRRIPCFPHTLQLPILKTVKQKMNSFGRPLKKTRRMVVKYRRSAKAKNILDQKFKRRLKGYCKTRWWTDNDMVRRVVEAKETDGVPDPLTYLVEEMEWSRRLIITDNDLRYLTGFLDIMEPLQEKSDLLGAEERSTINLVYPSLQEILAHLDQSSSGFTKTFATQLKSEIKKYFTFALDVESTKFEPIFMVGTYFSPIHRHLLSPNQIKIAEDHIRILLEEGEEISRMEVEILGDEQEGGSRRQDVGRRQEEMNRSEVQDEIREEVGEQTESVVPQKKQPIIPGLKFVSSQLLKNINNNSSSLENDLLLYASKSSHLLTKLVGSAEGGEGMTKAPENPMDFWAREWKGKHYSTKLAELALDVMAIPASSVPSERLFSISGLLSSCEKL